MKSDSRAVWIIKDTVWGHRRLVADTCEIFGMVNIRGVTIGRYIDTMYNDTMHQCHAENIDICRIKSHLYFGTVHIFI